MGRIKGWNDTGAGPAWRLDDKTVEAVLAARCPDPFAVLGPHEAPDGIAIRAFVPSAERLAAVPEDGAAPIPLEPRGCGFFEGFAVGRMERFRYRLRAANAGGSWDFIDPYALPPRAWGDRRSSSGRGHAPAALRAARRPSDAVRRNRGRAFRGLGAPALSPASPPRQPKRGPMSRTEATARTLRSLKWARALSA